jgi:hypothetical protein
MSNSGLHTKWTQLHPPQIKIFFVYMFMEILLQQQVAVAIRNLTAGKLWSWIWILLEARMYDFNLVFACVCVRVHYHAQSFQLKNFYVGIASRSQEFCSVSPDWFQCCCIYEKFVACGVHHCECSVYLSAHPTSWSNRKTTGDCEDTCQMICLPYRIPSVIVALFSSSF